MKKNTGLISLLSIIRNQRGQTMLLALVVFLLLITIETALLTATYLEKRMSINDVRLKQACQAADAALEWALADLYDSLAVQHGSEMRYIYHNKTLYLSNDPVPVYFEITTQDAEFSLEGRYDLITLNCRGRCGSAQREIIAKICFYYDIIERNDSGTEKKVYEQGKIIYYDIVDYY